MTMPPYNLDSSMQISYNYFNPKKKADRKYAIALPGADFNIKDIMAISKIIEKVDELRKEAVRWVNAQLTHMTIARAQKNGIVTPSGRLVENITELEKAHMSDGSMGMHKKMHKLIMSQAICVCL